MDTNRPRFAGGRILAEVAKRRLAAQAPHMHARGAVALSIWVTSAFCANAGIAAAVHPKLSLTRP
jgi:hypothetical protein